MELATGRRRLWPKVGAVQRQQDNRVRHRLQRHSGSQGLKMRSNAEADRTALWNWATVLGRLGAAIVNVMRDGRDCDFRGQGKGCCRPTDATQQGDGGNKSEQCSAKFCHDGTVNRFSRPPKPRLRGRATTLGAALPRLLNGRAWRVPKGTEHAAVARQRSQQRTTVLAVIEILTRISRHRLLRSATALRACQN
jgi:hypothetical protein